MPVHSGQRRTDAGVPGHRVSRKRGARPARTLTALATGRCSAAQFLYRPPPVDRTRTGAAWRERLRVRPPPGSRAQDGPVRSGGDTRADFGTRAHPPPRHRGAAAPRTAASAAGRRAANRRLESKRRARPRPEHSAHRSRDRCNRDDRPRASSRPGSAKARAGGQTRGRGANRATRPAPQAAVGPPAARAGCLPLALNAPPRGGRLWRCQEAAPAPRSPGWLPAPAR